ncbi:hypothetical protein ACSX1A_16085 [Pontibacter sp. MBLB2868]|uniref:hypothetical protein n=1 Tax=Pontibacter sp. MBLB2868 TaxID=3451555 RepID=UPI003F756E3E
MKIIILLLAFVFGFGATVKRSSDDIKKIKTRTEINQYKTYPNLLPEVEIVAHKS